MASKAGAKAATNAAKPGNSDEIKIVLQVGTEFRVSNKGDVILSNPELELAKLVTSVPRTQRCCTASMPAAGSTFSGWWTLSRITRIRRFIGRTTEAGARGADAITRAQCGRFAV
jgi:hypothetical protein